MRKVLFRAISETAATGRDLLDSRDQPCYRQTTINMAKRSKGDLCCPPGAPAAEVSLQTLEGAEADEGLAKMGKAIGHPARVRILRLLSRKEARVLQPDCRRTAIGAIDRFRAPAHSEGGRPGAMFSGWHARRLLHRFRWPAAFESPGCHHLRRFFFVFVIVNRR